MAEFEVENIVPARLESAHPIGRCLDKLDMTPDGAAGRSR